MTGKVLGVNSLAKSISKTTVKPGDSERAAIREMVKSAKERGLDITGPDGLLKLLTKTVLETALEEEMTDHLGYDCEDVVTASGLRPDPRYDRPLCLVLDLSTARSGVGCAAAGPGGRVPIGALPHKAPSQS